MHSRVPRTAASRPLRPPPPTPPASQAADRSTTRQRVGDGRHERKEPGGGKGCGSPRRRRSHPRIRIRRRRGGGGEERGPGPPAPARGEAIRVRIFTHLRCGPHDCTPTHPPPGRGGEGARAGVAPGGREGWCRQSRCQAHATRTRTASDGQSRQARHSPQRLPLAAPLWPPLRTHFQAHPSRRRRRRREAPPDPTPRFPPPPPAAAATDGCGGGGGGGGIVDVEAWPGTSA